jgi:bacterioferritin-associated ferredoxin
MDRTRKEQEIIEGLKPVCICKGIKKKAIMEKIKAGMTTVEELQRVTGAGSGSCKGERCTPRILELLRR